MRFLKPVQIRPYVVRILSSNAVFARKLGGFITKYLKSWGRNFDFTFLFLFFIIYHLTPKHFWTTSSSNMMYWVIFLFFGNKYFNISYENYSRIFPGNIKINFRFPANKYVGKLQTLIVTKIWKKNFKCFLHEKNCQKSQK